MAAHRSAFRFGVNLLAPGDRATWLEKCRRAERLRVNRERFGIGYVTVMESDMDAFADVIAALDTH